MTVEKAEVLMSTFPLIALIVSVCVGASVLNTWLRIRNGYPLQTSWGKAVHSQKTAGTAERVTLLTQENAQLRAELGSIKDRLATVERIVTDGGTHLSHQIEQLRDRRAN